MLNIDRIVRRLRGVERRARATTSFAALSDVPRDAVVPWLDRRVVDESRLSPLQSQWRRNGVVHLENFIPPKLMDAYCQMHARRAPVGGWDCPVPYMHLREIRELCLYRPVIDVLEHLLGTKMAMHLNETNWRSSGRAWHQVDYLNPPFVNAWCAGVWIALEDIHADSGPFQYITGSHRWPVMRGERVRALLSRQEAHHHAWPLHAEPLVQKIYEDEIARAGLTPEPFLGRRGDVLLWHGRLVNRDARPTDPTRLRKGIASHFSAINKRKDMPDVAWTREGAAFFVLENWPLVRGGDWANGMLSAG